VQSRFVSIENAPHDSINARPGAFNQAVLEFLTAVETQDGIAGRMSF
jgi:pimeloyl-ACP methyl ester carboxylesterase